MAELFAFESPLIKHLKHADRLSVDLKEAVDPDHRHLNSACGCPSASDAQVIYSCIRILETPMLVGSVSVSE